MGNGRAVGAPAARRAVVAASIGTLVEGYDLALYGYFAVILAGQFFPPDDPAAGLLATFAIFALGFAVRPLGGLFFGHIGDRRGRRPAVAASILLMAVATVGIAVLPTYGQVGLLAPVGLLVCRLLQGFSVGGEIAGGNVFVMEHAAAGWFGRAVSANLAAASVGLMLAAGASLLMAAVLDAGQLASWGWRVPFAVAAPLGLVGVYLRLRVADSPAFRADAAGRPRFPLAYAVRTQTRGMLIFAGFAAMVLLGSYLLTGYLPSFLTRVAGLSTTQTFTATLAAVVALAIGMILGGYLVDHFPPRTVAIGCGVGLVAAVLPTFLIVSQGTLVAAVLGLAPWAVVLGVGNVVGASLSLILFPAAVRYTATAFALNMTGAVFAGTGPYLSTWLVERTGIATTPAIYLIVVAFAGLAVAWRAIPGPPASGRTGRPAAA